MRPRRLEPGDKLTWRFKTKDYWQAIQAPKEIATVEELMALHDPWVTSSAPEVLQTISAFGGQTSLDAEGLIVVEVEDRKLDELNARLAELGCRLSNDLLHTL